MRNAFKLCAWVTLLLLSVSMVSSAATVKIIESPFTPGVDVAWETVALGLGHTAAIYPVSDLDVTGWIPATDVLIISDPFLPYTPLQIANVTTAMASGVSIYIQSEVDPALPGNTMFEIVVNSTGAAGFAWFGGPVPGLVEAKIFGPVAAQFNARKPVLGMMEACVGGSPGLFTGIVPNLEMALGAVGFLYDDTVLPGAGMVATNTDFEWIIPFGPDILLMENYLNTLITNVELTKFFPIIAPAGLITLPSSGGTITYTVEPANIGLSVFPTTLWVRAILPSGTVYPPPLAGPVVLMIPPLTSLGPVSLAMSVPAFAPPGMYYIQSMMTAGFPGIGLVYDTDFFMIEKMVIGPDDAAPAPGDGEIIATRGELSFPAAEANHTAQQVPRQFEVGQAYPNPFNPSTTIDVSLADAVNLTVTVYDVQGREVATLAKGAHTAGLHSFSFDASGLASGVYFLRANVPGQLNETRKLVLMR
ncbi:T9SS type A sorting domain-containing protein [bacterium]|nr:T9SS type A sorting domain-containing protein [bacterium]